MEMRTTRAKVGSLLAARAHQRAKTGQQCTMDARVACAETACDDAKLPGSFRYLAVHIFPFRETQQRELALLAPGAQCAARAFAHAAVSAPQFDHGGELGSIVKQ